MATILFKDLVAANETEIMSYMDWQNYDLVDTVLPVVDLLKEHALMVLSKSYGMFHVEQDILDPLCADVFMAFPILMQQLSITRIMEAAAIVPIDTNTETLTRTEQLVSEVDQTSELTVGTTTSDSTVLNTQQKTTGTVAVESDVTNTQDSTTNIENTSGVQSTGSHNVALSHNMPEQALSGTGNFPVDPQGTPQLGTAYVQSANENFATSNPINTDETSEQTITSTATGNTDSTTTNDITVADTGTNTRTQVNSGSDTSDSSTSTDSTNTITEDRTRTETNKQYAYEIKALLESVDTIKAFKIWENQFAWVCGII